MRTSILGLSALALLSLASPALAQDAGAPAEADPPSDITVSGGVSVLSDYRFRGVSLTDNSFAVQGTININHSSGFYVGVWASNLEDTPVYGNAEVDIYGGWTKEVIPGATVDVGLLYYYYPNNQSLAGDSDYFEPYASVKTTIGPVTAKGGIAYAWSQSATGNDDNVYIYGELSGGIPGTPVSLNSHIGYSSGSLSLSGSYVDWSLGADLALGHGLTVGVKYIDTDLNQLTGIPAADKLYGSTALFSVGVAF